MKSHRNQVKYRETANRVIRVCHFSTAHPADDVRIYHKECWSISRIEGFEISYIAYGGIKNGSENIRFETLGTKPSTRLRRMLKAQLLASRMVFRRRIDIWHIHDLELIPFGIFLTMLGKKVIWDAHEDYHLQFSSQVEYRTYLGNRLTKLAARFVVSSLLYIMDRRADAIISATNSIKLRYKNPNLVVVGNEAIIEEFAECQPSYNNENALFSGSADDSQCFSSVVKAIARYQGLKLVLVGDSVSSKQLTWAQDILGDRFIHRGRLKRKDYGSEISKAKLGFLTYSDAASNQYNSPNKLYEFGASGLPCIATPTLSNRNRFSKSGILVAKGFSAEDLLEKLVELCDSPKLWKELSDRGKEWTKHNGNWTNSEKELKKIYLAIQRELVS